MRLLVVLAIVSTAGCAHAPKGHWNETARRMCAGDMCYRVGELPGWRVVHQEGAAIGWFNEAFGAVVESNATCRDDAEASPLTTLTRHLLIGYTDRQIRKQEPLYIDGRGALRTIVDAKLDGVPMTLDLIVLKRNGCIFDLSLAAPPGELAAAEEAFGRFVAGFAQERS